MAYNKAHLSSGEQIVHVAHKHVIVLIRAAIQWILLFIFALIVAIFISAYNPQGQASDFVTTIRPFVQIICLVAMLVSFFAFGISYLVWAAEQYIITNERVIQVEGILNKKEFATSIEKINDIETDQTLFGRLLGYGTVRLLTGADTGINQLDYLNKPFEFKKIMLNAKNRYYGDASDYAPGGPRSYSTDGDDKPSNRHVHQEKLQKQQQQARQRPAAPPPQPVYQNDPRGYSPVVPPQQQPYQQPSVQATSAYRPPQQQPATPQQIADSIAQLARLRDNGIISEAEFQSKKTELMNRL
jgi:membrane protein YdbS with pleckstrin-like domain